VTEHRAVSLQQSSFSFYLLWRDELRDSSIIWLSTSISLSGIS